MRVSYGIVLGKALGEVCAVITRYPDGSSLYSAMRRMAKIHKQLCSRRNRYKLLVFNLGSIRITKVKDGAFLHDIIEAATKYDPRIISGDSGREAPF